MCKTCDEDYFSRTWQEDIFGRVSRCICVFAKSGSAWFDTTGKRRKKKIARQTYVDEHPESEFRENETEFSCKFLRPLLAFTLRKPRQERNLKVSREREETGASRAHRKPPPTRFYKYLNETVLF